MPGRRKVHSVVTLLMSSALAGCSRELPAPSAPAKTISASIDAPRTPPPAGHTRVVLDAVGEKASVVEITNVAHSRGYIAISTRPVCATPCTVDFSLGTHSLIFQSAVDVARRSELEIEVGTQPKVVRQALGERRGPGALGTAGFILVFLGAVAAGAGGALWLAGETSDSRDLATAGRLVTGASLGGAMLGIPLAIFDPPTHRPGATTEWTPPSGLGTIKQPGPTANGAAGL